MNRQLIYKISGGAVGLLIVGSTFLSIRQRKRDQKTSKLLTQIKKQLATTANNLDAENAFDIYYLTKVLQNVNGQVIAMSKSSATSYAKQINKAWGAWYEGGDDEDAVYAIFRKLKDKVQVSQVAKAYQSTYSKNLIDTIKNRLSEDEIKIILNIIAQIPNYRTA